VAAALESKLLITFPPVILIETPDQSATAGNPISAAYELFFDFVTTTPPLRLKVPLQLFPVQVPPIF
jgi:hypothetical protein